MKTTSPTYDDLSNIDKQEILKMIQYLDLLRKHHAYQIPNVKMRLMTIDRCYNEIYGD